MMPTALRPAPADAGAPAPPLLAVDRLRLVDAGATAAPALVDGVSLAVDAGEVVALVGESGSGKSLTALSLLRLLPPGVRIAGGAIRFTGDDVLAMGERRLNRLRGGQIGMVFQQPLAMLDPTATVGSQVAEGLRLHHRLSRRQAWGRAVELLAEVGIPAAAARARSYAHQLSGGMAQRVMIAAALSGDPRLLIADEPTTALDVTVQLQILQLLERARRDRGLAILLISHDLAIVSALADRIAVMYGGRIVEDGLTADVLRRPRHPYTQALVRSALLRDDGGAPGTGRLFAIPGSGLREQLPARGCRFLPRCPIAADHGSAARCAAEEPPRAPRGDTGQVRCWCDGAAEQPPDAPAAGVRPTAERPALVRLDAVSRHYPIRTGWRGPTVVRSVDAVTLDIRGGEVLGLVGESGCGKSTLARLLLRMTRPDGGTIAIAGRDPFAAAGPDLRQLRRTAQLVFQDPFGALDPSMSLGESLDAPLAQNRMGTRGERRHAILAMLDAVGLDGSILERRPSQCSGGQLQRVVIARALLMGPRFLVCDEPTSALDASVRAQVLNLLMDLRRRFDLTVLLISHDLRVVRHLCDRVAVMYLGEIVEIADRERLFSAPGHPYTRALIASSLIEPGRLPDLAVAGEPPSPLDPPAGCRFHTRCPIAEGRCSAEAPTLTAAGSAQAVRCHLFRPAVDIDD